MEYKNQNSMTHRTRFRQLCLLLLCCLTSSIAHASSYQLTHTFRPDDPENAPLFGSAVALEDGIAVIKSNSGYVDQDGLSVTHIFEERSDGGWDETATLAYDSGDDFGNPYLGEELAIDNGEIVIGYSLPYRELSSSHVQFATKDANGWSVQFNEPTATETYPSRTVDISGNLTIVGSSYGSSLGDSYIRSAGVYEKSESGIWSESSILIPDIGSNISSYRSFDVAIYGNTAMIGYRSTSDDGIIYFYEKNAANAWAEVSSFAIGSNNNFPFVEIEGHVAIASDPFHGALTIYERISGSWEETMSTSIDGISKGMAIDNGIIAYTVDPRDDSPRSVILARKTLTGSWETFETIYDPNPELYSLFGDDLAFDQGRLLIGNWGNEQGVAYLFAPVPEPSSVLLVLFASTLGCFSRRRFQ